MEAASDKNLALTEELKAEIAELSQALEELRGEITSLTKLNSEL